MKTFTDYENRIWRIRVTIGSIQRVQAELPGGPDLLALAIGEPNLCARLADDEALRCHVIWALVMPQAEELGVSQLSFLDLMDAPTFAAASSAFWGELIDFFRTLGQTEIVDLIEATLQIEESIRTKNRKQIAANLQRVTSGSLSGTVPESSVSDPAKSPS